MSTITEVDTFGYFQKAQEATGGLQMIGLYEGTLTRDYGALTFRGYGDTDNTAKTTAAGGYIHFDARKTAGTTVDFIGTDANILTIGQNGTTRFIFDKEGSAHADVEWTTYDTYDDLALINEVEYELLGVEGAGQTDRRKYLEGAGIIGQDSWHFENGKQRAMVNFSKLSMLHHGALMQMGENHMSLAEKVDGLEVELIEAKKQLAAISA